MLELLSNELRLDEPPYTCFIVLEHMPVSVIEDNLESVLWHLSHDKSAAHVILKLPVEALVRHNVEPRVVEAAASAENDFIHRRLLKPILDRVLAKIRSHAS